MHYFEKKSKIENEKTFVRLCMEDPFPLPTSSKMNSLKPCTLDVRKVKNGAIKSLGIQEEKAWGKNTRTHETHNEKEEK